MSDWRKSAACAGYDPALWFPGNSQLMRREAIHICHTCPVMMQCRKYAEQTIKSADTHYRAFGAARNSLHANTEGGLRGDSTIQEWVQEHLKEVDE